MIRRAFKTLYFWVLVGVVAGALTGLVAPDAAQSLKVLGDIFLKLLKMLIAPIVFVTIVLGIAGMRDLKSVGRVGGKALLYFEVLTTIALALGLLFVNALRPGAGFHVDPASLDAVSVASYVAQGHAQTLVGFLQNLVPATMFAALANGDLLQVLFVAVLVGLGAASAGARAAAFTRILEALSATLLEILAMLMKLAPLGVFGAMAYTIGAHGFAAVTSLAALLGVFYLTCGVFIFGVLGLVCRAFGFSLLRLIAALRTEILTAFGTASSESVLAPLMEKLETMGCSRSVVGLVVPSGYSFNMDGSSIYVTVAAVFLAQAQGIDLSLSQQLTLLGVAMLTSKGASGVTGAGFIVLAMTLASVQTVPVASIALILGVDRFMGEGRVVTNLIGNAVAALVISAWEGELNRGKLHEALRPRPITKPVTS
jgi:aerobic C4-dicarboxylate transport protein